MQTFCLLDSVSKELWTVHRFFFGWIRATENAIHRIHFLLHCTNLPPFFSVYRRSHDFRVLSSWIHKHVIIINKWRIKIHSDKDTKKYCSWFVLRKNDIQIKLYRNKKYYDSSYLEKPKQKHSWSNRYWKFVLEQKTNRFYSKKLF